MNSSMLVRMLPVEPEQLVATAGVIAGVALLMWGPWLLRTICGLALFAGASAATALAVTTVGPSLGAAAHPAVQVIIPLLAGCLAASLVRFTVVGRWLEVITLSASAAWYLLRGPVQPVTPEIFVLCAALITVAGLLWRSAVVGLMSALSFSAALHIQAPEVVAVVVALCLATAWVRHGRLPASRIAWRTPRRGPRIQVAGQPAAVEIVCAFARADAAIRWCRGCVARGWSAEPLASNPVVVIAALPRRVAAAWQQVPQLMTLVRGNGPAVIDDAATMLRVERPALTRAGTTISLDEITKRLRKGVRGAGTGGEGVEVAVIDTGGDPGRPEYADRVVHRESFVPGVPEADDDSDVQHGSNAAMIIATIAPAAQISFFKAFSGNGGGQLAWIVRAMDAAAEREPVDVVNCSFGYCACRGTNRCVLCRMVEGLGVTVVASAGNGGNAGVSCPAASRGALAVAACDRDGNVADFSARGPSLSPSNPKPDLTGYGVGVLLRTTTDGPNGVAMDGTSFSAPEGAGAAADVIGAARATGVTLEPAEVRRLLRTTACPKAIAGRDRSPDVAGAGLISPAAALAALRRGRPVAFDGKAALARARCCTAPLAAAAGLVLLVAAWWFGLDHAGGAAAWSSFSDVRLVGRLVTGPAGELRLDDGTASIRVRGTDDAPGTVVCLSGRWLPHVGAVEARHAFPLWSPGDDHGNNDNDKGS